MKNESKIYLFKDRKDYIKKITNDNIYNITGEKGSGKSYFGNLKDNDKSCVVIHLDPIFMPNGNKVHNDSSEVRNLLIDKYNEPLSDVYFEKKYYNLIIEHLINKNKESYIEGGCISDIKDISKIRGTVIVKRTGVLKCFIRAVKRDYNNSYFMDIEIKKHGNILGKIYRLKNVIKRRKKIFKEYHRIENFINELENYCV